MGFQRIQPTAPGGIHNGQGQPNHHHRDAQNQRSIPDGFPTTEEEDRALVEAGGMSPRMEMCVRYRMLQKQNVTAFRRFLEAVTREAKKA